MSRIKTQNEFIFSNNNVIINFANNTRRMRRWKISFAICVTTVLTKKYTYYLKCCYQNRKLWNGICKAYLLTAIKMEEHFPSLNSANRMILVVDMRRIIVLSGDNTLIFGNFFSTDFNIQAFHSLSWGLTFWFDWFTSCLLRVF